MNNRRTIFTPETYEEICLLKRRLDYLERSNSFHAHFVPGHLDVIKQLFHDMDIDRKAFAKLISGITEPMNSNKDAA